jgi:hypothetical protein
MLIPHIVVLYFLNIAFAVVAFIGWWGALFAGELPEFAVSYLSGVTRWYTRVQAYALLLTDQYPPFSLGDEPGYPVRIAIPSQVKLNRLAVLFRIILMIPASVLNGLVTYGGTTIVAVIAWVIVLITGKLPTSLHLAYTAVLRYTTRCNCYFVLLTAAYPGGLFGDGLAVPYGATVALVGDFGPVAPGDAAPAPAPADSDSDSAAAGDESSADSIAPGYAAPGDAAPASPEVPSYGIAGSAAPGDEASASADVPGYGIPGYPAPGYVAPAGPANWPPADWQLLLTRGVRQLLGWFIAIGVVLWVAWIAGGAVSGFNSHPVSAASAIRTVNVANNTLASELSTYQKTVQACTNASCVETADTKAATAFSTFASAVRGTPMPGSAVTAANKVSSDASEVAQDLTKLSRLGTTISPTQYQSEANSTGINQATTQLQQDFDALANTLNAAR